MSEIKLREKIDRLETYLVGVSMIAVFLLILVILFIVRQHATEYVSIPPVDDKNFSDIKITYQSDNYSDAKINFNPHDDMQLYICRNFTYNGEYVSVYTISNVTTVNETTELENISMQYNGGCHIKIVKSTDEIITIV